MMFLASSAQTGSNATALTLAHSGVSGLDEVCLVGYSDHYYYDENGSLEQKTDRNGRAATYAHDGIGRVVAEQWYDAVDASGNPAGNATETIDYTYTAAGRLHTASNANGTYTYTYDDAGAVTLETQEIAGLPMITFDEQYTAGKRTQLAMKIGATADFVNTYQYQSVLGQMSQVTQSGVSGGNNVAAKSVSSTYNRIGQFYTIARYAEADPAKLVAESTYGFDNAGRLTSLDYAKDGSTLPTYAWAFDALGNMTGSTYTWDDTVESTGYASDSTGQLTAANHNYQDDEAYSYDANGNRNSADYTTGANNQLLSQPLPDGSRYDYTYDAEGNRISRAHISNGALADTAEYAWDNHNRLTSVTFRNNAGAVTKTVTYKYDAFDRWIAETIDEPGKALKNTRYVYDGNQIVAQFENTGTGAMAATDLKHRYLWNPQAVDQLFADEQVHYESGQGQFVSDEVLWALTDHINTVRDLATYASGTTTVANHRVFSAYGELESQTDDAADSLFAFTGRPLSRATGLQQNGARWYDAIVGRWLNEDPIGIAAGDPNFSRYCGNAPTDGTDPEGLDRRINVMPPGHFAIIVDTWSSECDKTGQLQLDWDAWQGYTVNPVNPLGVHFFPVGGAASSDATADKALLDKWYELKNLGHEDLSRAKEVLWRNCLTISLYWFEFGIPSRPPEVDQQWRNGEKFLPFAPAPDVIRNAPWRGMGAMK